MGGNLRLKLAICTRSYIKEWSRTHSLKKNNEFIVRSARFRATALFTPEERHRLDCLFVSFFFFFLWWRSSKIVHSQITRCSFDQSDTAVRIFVVGTVCKAEYNIPNNASWKVVRFKLVLPGLYLVEIKIGYDFSKQETLRKLLVLVEDNYLGQLRTVLHDFKSF